MLALAAVAVLVAAPAAAQVAESFEELRTSSHGGERLRVTERRGGVSSGTLLAFIAAATSLNVSPIDHRQLVRR